MLAQHISHPKSLQLPSMMSYWYNVLALSKGAPSHGRLQTKAAIHDLCSQIQRTSIPQLQDDNDSLDRFNTASTLVASNYPKP